MPCPSIRQSGSQSIRQPGGRKRGAAQRLPKKPNQRHSLPPVCAPTAAAHSSHQQHLAHLRVELVVILNLLHRQKRSSLCGQIACLPDGGTNLHTQLDRTGGGARRQTAGVSGDRAGTQAGELQAAAGTSSGSAAGSSSCKARQAAGRQAGKQAVSSRQAGRQGEGYVPVPGGRGTPPPRPSPAR